MPNTKKNTSSKRKATKKKAATAKKKSRTSKKKLSSDEALKKVKQMTRDKTPAEEQRLAKKLQQGKNISLFLPNKNPKKGVKGTGFANAQKARDTIEICARDCRDMVHQKQVIVTMYNRAKFHPHQKADMREAMKVFAVWLKAHGLKAD